MGRICPILNHPLNDGVLVEDEAIVGFIQKRNIDFLPNELVCRSCKREVIKLYQKKKKKATALYKSLYHDGSVSSLSKSSKASSIASERSLTRNELQQSNGIINNNNTTVNSNNSNSSISVIQQNGNKTNSFAENNNSKNSSSLSKTSSPTAPASKVTENQNKQQQQQQPNQRKTIPGEIGKNANVTVRKRTIRDFLTIQPPPPPQAATRHIVASDEDDNNEVIRRLSQEPTTSSKANGTTKTAVNSNKRPISAIVDDESDNDDERLSLNAYNGTRLPHIQPIPPKRKPVADRAISMARDIMDEYIKDITGG